LGNDLAFGHTFCYQWVMSKVEKISIALTADMLAAVNQAVESGRYATVSEVVRDALRDWIDDAEQSKLKLEQLRKLIADSHISGAMPYGGVDGIIADGRRYLDQAA
jgi:antitoxin ParD1/3/4